MLHVKVWTGSGLIGACMHVWVAAMQSNQPKSSSDKVSRYKSQVGETGKITDWEGEKKGKETLFFSFITVYMVP